MYIIIIMHSIKTGKPTQVSAETGNYEAGAGSGQFPYTEYRDNTYM